MKILHLFHELKYSGAEIMYAQAAALFQKDGLDMIAFSTGPTLGDFAPVFIKNNIKVFHKQINFKAFSLKGFKYYIELYRFLKNEKIDVIQIHRSDLIFAGIVAWLAKTKCIKTQHNTFRNRWFTLPYGIAWRFMLRRIFNVIFQTIGESVYNNELKYYKNPSVRINNWFDANKFFPVTSTDEKNQLRDSLDIPKENFVIVSTGGCSHIKNHHDIIKALALISSRIEVLYLHLGQGATESEERQIAVDLGISDRIRFLGNQQNVRDFLVAADLYVMTSRFEGLSIASLEAMACKLPCILYDAPGLRDLINDNDNGILIKSDHYLLAEKINDVHENRTDALARAEEAFRFANSEYSITINVNKIIALYKS